MWRALDQALGAERTGATGSAAPPAPEPQRLPLSRSTSKSTTKANGVSRFAKWTGRLPWPEAEPLRLPAPIDEPAISVATRALMPGPVRMAPAAGRDVDGVVSVQPEVAGAGQEHAGGANGETLRAMEVSQQRRLSELIRLMVQREILRLVKG